MDKGKLKKLNQLVARLSSMPENKWMVDDLLKQVSLKAEVANDTVHPILHTIHEQCIEENIQAQAEAFYKNFPFEEIKPKLIGYMIKMEHERRRGDFEGFGLAMFQQLECLGNYCFQLKPVINKVSKLKDRFAFLVFDGNTKEWKPATKGHELLAVLMNKYDKPTKTFLMGRADQEQYFNDDGTPNQTYRPGKKTWNILSKIKLALYLFHFQEKMKQKGFSEVKDFLDEIYAVRNQVHPESKTNNWNKETLERIAENKSQYMFRFYGYLGKLMGKLEVDSEFRIDEIKDEKKIKYAKGVDLKDGRAPKLGEKKVVMDLEALKGGKRKK